ncbi:geranylgeranyl diphosphate synthase, type I [Streptomyces sp. yr375]|uniref:polyprenyl synthetase family protein n=1 Tax=Streptomyces sp. yr375 TaxID=1761906 RepID=UPI0008BABFB3|nr:polyprenyl synthetase family protein [Streptomyces sp. yr375]SEQ48558.1 geranylgeranyl diphosphate synthase, type I [Streptomyces sp. yr375]
MTLIDEFTESSAVAARVNGLLDDFLRERTTRETHPETRDVLETLRTFTLNGGKRIRPLFCYWGWRGAADPDAYADTDACADVVAVAAALELFHTAALIHDDIIDNSDVRRGRPTIHRALGTWHAGHGWRGESGAFGQSGALLAGNACLVWSEELFHANPLVARDDRARRLFARLRTSAVYGEFLDLVGEARGGRLNDALKIIRHKTASYTVRYPLQIGGALAGADDTLMKAYDTFGLLLGEAFQLRDDLIGLFGAPEVTGKDGTDDVRQGKPTALIALARELADPRQSARLDLLYGAPEFRADDMGALRDVVTATGAPEAIERMIEDRHTDAVRALREAGVERSALAELESLAAAAVHRER